MYFALNFQVRSSDSVIMDRVASNANDGLHISIFTLTPNLDLRFLQILVVHSLLNFKTL